MHGTVGSALLVGQTRICGQAQDVHVRNCPRVRQHKSCMTHRPDGASAEESQPKSVSGSHCADRPDSDCHLTGSRLEKFLVLTTPRFGGDVLVTPAVSPPMVPHVVPR